MFRYLFCLLFFYPFISYGQVRSFDKTKGYKSFVLEINDQKAVSAFFENDIMEVYSPSANIIASFSETDPKLLNVSTKKKFLERTTLLVLDSEGNVYNFLLDFATRPQQLVYEIKDYTLQKAQPQTNSAVLELFHGIKDEQQQGARKAFYNRLLRKSKSIKDVAKLENALIVSLYNVFFDAEYFFFTVRIKNLTSVDFEINSFKVFAKSLDSFSKQKLRESVDIEVCDVYPDTPKIISNNQFFVIKIKKRSLTAKKFLVISAIDEIGDRNAFVEIFLPTLAKGQRIETKNS